MSSEMALFWKQELTLNDARASWLDGHISALRCQRQTAGARRELDGELQDAIQRELDDGLAELKRVQARGHRLRSALSLRVMNKFPDEILRHIFLDVTILPETEKPIRMWDVGRCGQRAKAPVVLSAVCTRWRQVALEIPQLWAYIYLPIHPARAVLPGESCDLVRLLLARSQRAPLDIYLPWSEDKETDWEPYSPTAEARTLGLLTADSRRWRSIGMGVASGALTVTSLSFLRCVTPVLERCDIVRPLSQQDQSLQWTGNFPNFLPACASLRYFRSEWDNIVPMLRLCDGPYPPLAVLTLHLGPSIPCSKIWDILRLAAPSLQQLELEYSRHPTDRGHVIRTPITFTRLNALRYNARAGDMNAGLAQSRRLRQKTDLHVEELILWAAELSESDVAELPFFPHIRRLVLEEFYFTEEFLDELTSPRADGTWTLPALEVVVLGDGALVDSERDDGENLIRLIQARRDANRSGGHNHPPSLRIEVLNNASAPSWVRDQIRYIMENDPV